jgi:hypothetical protein
MTYHRPGARSQQSAKEQPLIGMVRSFTAGERGRQDETQGHEKSDIGIHGKLPFAVEAEENWFSRKVGLSSGGY